MDKQSGESEEGESKVREGKMLVKDF